MTYFNLFLIFFKVGLFSFGGGYAILPLMQHEVVDVNKWISFQEFMDIVAVSQITPGPISINLATYVGYRIGGTIGSTIATTSVVLPSFFIVLFLSQILLAYGNHPIVVAIFNGVKPAITALILISVYRIGKSANINRYNFVIPLIVAVLIKYFGVSPILIIIATMILGNIFYILKEKKEDDKK